MHYALESGTIEFSMGGTNGYCWPSMRQADWQWRLDQRHPWVDMWWPGFRNQKRHPTNGRGFSRVEMFNALHMRHSQVLVFYHQACIVSVHSNSSIMNLLSPGLGTRKLPVWETFQTLNSLSLKSLSTFPKLCTACKILVRHRQVWFEQLWTQKKKIWAAQRQSISLLCTTTVCQWCSRKKRSSQFHQGCHPRLWASCYRSLSRT